MVGSEHPRALTTHFFGGLAPFDGISTIKTAKKLLGDCKAVLREINSLDWRAWRVGKTANRFLKFWRPCPIAGGLARWLSAEPPCPSDAPFRCLDCRELFFRALDRPPGMPVCLSRFLQFVDGHRPIGQ